MCKINFVLSKKPIPKRFKKFLVGLWMDNSLDNQDGFGFVTEKSLWRSVKPFHKVATTYDDDEFLGASFMHIVQEESRYILQHARRASSGSRSNLKIEETHPFIFGDEESNYIELVHNGTLRLLKYKAVMDSKHLTKSIYDSLEDNSPEEAIRNGFKKFVGGSFATVMKVNGNFYIAKNDKRTLWRTYFTIDGQKILLVNTSFLAIKRLITMLRLFNGADKYGEIKLVSKGLYKISPDLEIVKIGDTPKFGKRKHHSKKPTKTSKFSETSDTIVEELKELELSQWFWLFNLFRTASTKDVVSFWERNTNPNTALRKILNAVKNKERFL
jgi:hypothetical protein